MQGRPAKKAWSLPRHRTRALSVLFVTSAMILILRLVSLSLAPATHYGGFVQTESSAVIPINSYRGQITDASGQVLALSVPAKSVVADPLQITDPVVESHLLATDMMMQQTQLRLAMLQSTQFVYLARLIPDSQARKISEQISSGLLPGISLITEQKRVYPAGPELSPVLGTTNSFGQGIAGLEYQFNNLLSGHNGSKVENVSVSGLPLPAGTVSYTPAVNGDNIQLTVDSGLQYVTERALAAQVEATKALSGVAIVMDVKTGNILALANVSAPPLPGQVVSANSAVPVGAQRSLPAEAPTNLATNSVYEPGSVVKLAVFTAALEHRVVKPTTILTVPDHMLIDGSLFHDAEPHPVENLSVGQILGQSSNIGTIEIAKRLGKTALNASMIRFGWGIPTGLAFPGASQGYLDPPSRWSGTAIGSVPIGQDEALTPLQILDAYNAIANGGIMEPPKLVKSITTPDGKVVKIQTPAAHRIVSVGISKTIAGLLQNAITADGTAPSAAIPGYTIAGKTGTSQKPWPTASGYQPGAFWATFVGFAPAQHPVLSAYVMLNQPDQIYGGVVAAPVFSHVMSYALAKYGVLPDGQITKSTLGSLVSPTVTTSVALASSAGQTVVTMPSWTFPITPNGPNGKQKISGQSKWFPAIGKSKLDQVSTTLSWVGSPWIRGRIGAAWEPR